MASFRFQQLLVFIGSFVIVTGYIIPASDTKKSNPNVRSQLDEDIMTVSKDTVVQEEQLPQISEMMDPVPYRQYWQHPINPWYRPVINPYMMNRYAFASDPDYEYVIPQPMMYAQTGDYRLAYLMTNPRAVAYQQMAFG